MGPKEPELKETEIGLPTITSYPISLHMTSALRGRGDSQFLTKGRERGACMDLALPRKKGAQKS